MDRTSQTAQGLASKGRYGDTMLVHMNPEEVAGLASLAPEGMTINPETGLPEAFKIRDFLKIALPIAGSIIAPQLLLTQGASALATGVAAGGGSAFGTLLAGGSSQEALQSGLLTGLTAGVGTKLAGGAQAAGAGGEAATTTPAGNTFMAGNPEGAGFSSSTASSTAGSAPLSFGESFSPATTGEQIAERTGDLFTTENIGSTLGRGAAGALGTYASTPIEEIPEEEYDVGLAEPWRRKYTRKPPGYVGEFQYFDPSGIYGASGGYVKNMQEGGEVEDTASENNSLGLMAYAPLIADYPSYDAGLGAMPEYNPTPMQPTIRTDMGESNYRVAPVDTGSGAMGRNIDGIPGLQNNSSYDAMGNLTVSDVEARTPKMGLMGQADRFDARKAPEGFMWSANTPDIAPGIRGNTTYKLFPTKNLSEDDMQDLTSRGILTSYRPEGVRYTDYRPQVELKEMQEGGLATISEGMVSGAGDGMSDNVYGNIDGTQRVALSEGEFIVPADVVSGIGNGSSESGAEELYAMMDRIRKARTGTMQQAPAIDVSVMMPS